MKLLNFFLLFFAGGFLLHLYFYSLPENQRKQTKQEKNKNILLSSNKDAEREYIGSLEPMSLKSKREVMLVKNLEVENRSSTISSEPQKIIFKTSEDVLNAHFPYLGEMLGKEGRDEFKVQLPVGFMMVLESITEEQKIEYRKLVQERREEIDAFTENKEHFHSAGEYQTYKEKRDIVEENYVPLIFNLLTDPQQKELSLFLKENFFEKIKHRYK